MAYAPPTPNWFVSLLFGSDPTKWDRWKHSWTSWQYWRHPPADYVEVPKLRLSTTGPRMPWPTAVGIRDGEEVEVPFPPLSVPSSLYRAPHTGSCGGDPIMLGGTGTRTVTWGIAEWGQRYRATIPLPAKPVKWDNYWTEGYPNPGWDRHCVIVAPDGDVHELIQLDPHAAENPFTNQANGWGRWRNGELIEGKSITATGTALHSVAWSPWSGARPHTLGIGVPDYVGADGQLIRGPKAGALTALRTDSDSYREMVALGGECKALATAWATFGGVIKDRSGYVDFGKPVGDTAVGLQPIKPSILFQAAGQWGDTNVAQFRVSMTDVDVLI